MLHQSKPDCFMYSDTTWHRLHCLSRSLRLYRITPASECTYRCRKRELWQNVSVMSAPASAAHSHYSLYDGAEVHYGSSESSGCLLTYLTVHKCACGDVWWHACRFWVYTRAEVHVTQVSAEDQQRPGWWLHSRPLTKAHKTCQLSIYQRAHVTTRSGRDMWPAVVECQHSAN